MQADILHGDVHVLSDEQDCEDAVPAVCCCSSGCPSMAAAAIGPKKVAYFLLESLLAYAPLKLGLIINPTRAIWMCI